jgi:hypothetical protein
MGTLKSLSAKNKRSEAFVSAGSTQGIQRLVWPIIFHADFLQIGHGQGLRLPEGSRPQ